MPTADVSLLHTEYFCFGLPVSREAWQRYALDHLETATLGAQPVQMARGMAECLNQERDKDFAQTGELMALMLLNEIFRHIINHYNSTVMPKALAQALDWTGMQYGPQMSVVTLGTSLALFPPEPVRKGETTPRIFLGGDTDKPLTHREQVVRETLLLSLCNANPAAGSYRDLYDDSPLKQHSPYEEFLNALQHWFEAQPPMPETGMTLFKMLHAPLKACPESLEGQLEYVRGHWTPLLPEALLEQLQIVQGVIQEETAFRGLGPGPSEALSFGALDAAGYPEFEAFSIDKDWMPNLVLIAKTVYVWLDQLSKEYGRAITRLDQIPDEALDRLASWGFTGLWLIGLWERSPSSRDIKQRMGNPEAAASAYSLYDYVIAADLGGEAAHHDLADRAWKRGIRLASDMVPNHMGVYSHWVVDHPDWFIQSQQPPFPSYTFDGPNLSHNDRVGIYIEDGYWNHSDAAVVFKRVDHHTGDTRYIYHGNDGTSMPWNDTAQLDFTIHEVREAVIQTILHVARQFPIIRFDAAMTLAKKHYQRLWFPLPGDAGAIPSRAEHGLTKPAFDTIFPEEFWREVVDRVAVEAPETLLLAEAFWLMEGYFVRTLGMHRVYNSAFMNMLKLEENSEYRQTIKNVLEFSPEILQRFVNFMNNPDEDTAEAQFGKGDKYIGVAIMMVTLPGLPMFGHGQIEGYTEKYGMEYRRAYWDETVDSDLVARHEREVFPIMRHRHIFSGSHNFVFYDFVAPEGHVDENVFAYSNQHHHDRGLIIYNNAYNTTKGVLHTSTAINVDAADTPHLVRVSLAQAMGLSSEKTCYYIYKDMRTGLEYLHYAHDLAEYGLHLSLEGYQYYALMDWREVHDRDGSWGRLHGALAGKGVPDVQEAYLEMHLAPLIEAFEEMFRAEHLQGLVAAKQVRVHWAAFAEAMTTFLKAVTEHLNRPVDVKAVLTAIQQDLRNLKAFAKKPAQEALYPESLSYLKTLWPDSKGLKLNDWRVPLAWGMLRHIGLAALPEKDDPTFSVEATSAAWLQEWLLRKRIALAFNALEGDEWSAIMDARLVRICIAHGKSLMDLQEKPWGPIFHPIITDPDVRAFLQVNNFGGNWWMNKEQLERMFHMFYLTQVLDAWPLNEHSADQLLLCQTDIQSLLNAAEDTGYNLNVWFESLK